MWAMLRDGTTFEARSAARHFHRDSLPGVCGLDRSRYREERGCDQSHSQDESDESDHSVAALHTSRQQDTSAKRQESRDHEHAYRQAERPDEHNWSEYIEENPIHVSWQEEVVSRGYVAVEDVFPGRNEENGP